MDGTKTFEGKDAIIFTVMLRLCSGLVLTNVKTRNHFEKVLKKSYFERENSSAPSWKVSDHFQ